MKSSVFAQRVSFAATSPTWLVLLACLHWLPAANSYENVCKEPFQCYECSSFRANESMCSDPFNSTEYDRVVRKSDCKDACVKWVIKESPDAEEKVIRTCSSQLDIRFPVNFVCIHETRSGYGSLCFCNKDLCNSAYSSNSASTCIALTFMVIAFLVQRGHCLYR